MTSFPDSFPDTLEAVDAALNCLEKLKNVIRSAPSDTRFLSLYSDCASELDRIGTVEKFKRESDSITKDLLRHRASHLDGAMEERNVAIDFFLSCSSQQQQKKMDMLEESRALDRLVVNELMDMGLMDAAMAMVREADLTTEQGFRTQDFAKAESNRLACEALIKQHDVEPALRWIETNSPIIHAQDLSFRLHRLRFIQLSNAPAPTSPPAAGTGNTAHTNSRHHVDAVTYAQQHFGPFLARYKPEIDSLMGGLLFPLRPSTNRTSATSTTTPLSDALSSEWESLAKTFSNGSLGRSRGSRDASLLHTIVEASNVCLNELIKYRAFVDASSSSGGKRVHFISSPIVAATTAAATPTTTTTTTPPPAPAASATVSSRTLRRTQEFFGVLPTSLHYSPPPPPTPTNVVRFRRRVFAPSSMLESDDEDDGVTPPIGSSSITDEELPVSVDVIDYHSTLICPVSRQPCTIDDPPVLLICGHVISKSSMIKLSRMRKFKCPTCPVEQRLEDILEVKFGG